ncbi:Uncharacterised protein [Chromobacterium vaccinii]|nr:Uncharacterised protein [Chromobacterium vaccinii]
MPSTTIVPKIVLLGFDRYKLRLRHWFRFPME